MNHVHCKASEKAVLQHFANLRKMMIKHHEIDNLAEFVMHALCAGPCLHIDKAVYFVNNPDFKILRGVTGYHQKEQNHLLQNSWDNQEDFVQSMHNSKFNQKVKGAQHDHFYKGDISEKRVVQKLVDDFEFEQPVHHVFDVKYANHGLLIYQLSDNGHKHNQDYFIDSLYYLGFCPVI
ncbi:MAG: hypothetical protein ACXWL2_04390 [Candidatus Chromulinivorax sp.]